jgi:hypothetical protein
MTKKRSRTKATSRNAPCPCGSGRKHKHCCGRARTAREEAFFQDAFTEIPDVITTYLLDTCVWGEIAGSASATDVFVSRFQSENLLAGLTLYTLFELSRAERLPPQLDSLFLGARHNIWLALLYDQVLELELKSYPSPPVMRWMPMSMISDEQQPSVMSKLSYDRRFMSKRDEHLQFGYAEFMTLERFKENYAPDVNGHYTPNQAEEFATFNAVEFLGRHFPRFLERLRLGAPALDSSKIPSIHMRSLFLFYKYYIHHKVPQKSDFMDFAAVSYTPYVDVYVTERDVMNVLMHIRTSGLMPSETDVMHVGDFIGALSSKDPVRSS